MITESKPNGEWRVPGVELSKLDMRLQDFLHQRMSCLQRKKRG